MRALYDQWVLKPGELPVEQQLEKVGLEISGQVKYAHPGEQHRADQMSKIDQKWEAAV